jgi:CheY-like chemotaxis protein
VFAPGSTVILNVNDDEAARYVVRRILERAGYQVREASTGLDALASVREQKPALVVLDIQLPDISGLEVCRRLKSDPATADIPVLQTSATFVSADRKVEGLESGADGYLAQPIEPPELLATVRALLRANVAEQQVREAASDWQRTFDALVEAILVVDADGTVMRVNKAARSMASRDELVGYSIENVMARLLGGSRVDWLHAARVGSTRESTVVPVGDRWIEVSVDHVVEGGDSDRFVVVLSDVSAQRRLVEHERRRAAELAEANSRKDEFLAMLAHELRNPLNAISTANSLASRLPEGDARLEWVRETITRQAGQLSRMVDDLLEVARIARGRVQIQSQQLDLKRVLSHAADASKPATESRRQRVRLKLPVENLPMLGDPLRLEQVFVNVINNAAKYSEAGSEIDIVCTRESDYAVIKVIDRGIGIRREHLEAVFEPFMQVDQSLARTLGGIGVGLTLARGLVEQHRGTIRAESEGAGRGTTVTIELPLGTFETAEVAAQGASGSGAEIDALSVLVIDDNKEAAELLRSLLETRRHTVHIANDGPSGLDAALTLCPDAALIDIGLPGIDGYQVAASLRASQRRDIFLIAITGYGRPEDRARALESGFDHFIVKPLRIDELERVLGKVHKQAGVRR